MTTRLLDSRFREGMAQMGKNMAVKTYAVRTHFRVYICRKFMSSAHHKFEIIQKEKARGFYVNSRGCYPR